MLNQQTKGYRWPDGRDGALEMVATAQPARWGGELLRSFAHPGLKLAGHAHEHLAGLVEIGVLPGQRDRGLARMLGASPTEDINQGRLVMASSRASGLARRTNRLHQL